MLEPLHFDHAGVSVADLARSRRWYGDVLGFTIVEDEFALPQYDFIGAVLRNATGVRIELFERKGSQPVRVGDPSGDTIVQGWFQFALAVRALDETFAHVVAAGAKAVMHPKTAPDGRARVAFIVDPDNNLIELIQRPT